MPGRSRWERLGRRSAVLVALGVFTWISVFTVVPGPLASAQEVQDTAVFFGFVSPSPDGSLPTRVQAQIAEVNCGTASVTQAAENLGFYILTAVANETKVGCGVPGAPVMFLLLRGELDDGVPAAQTQAWLKGITRLDLSAVPDVAFGAFVGKLPAGAGIGMMRWSGVSGTPIDEAIATIPRTVEFVAFFDVSTQSFLNFVQGAPPSVSTYLIVDSDDIVTVRVR
jgi:hypothetical protein